MPELPEVETIRRDLSEHLAGRCITEVELPWEGVVAQPDPSAFVALVAGRCVSAVRRRGKYLIWDLDSGARLLVHLRMTGRLYWTPAGAPRSPHVRAVLHLDDGRELHFADQRKFGRFSWVAGERELAALLGAKLGPEPLESGFTPEGLQQALSARRGPIKAVLLDQRLLAGLGNIYVDEALFRARLHPLRPAKTLTAEEVERLYAAIQAALRQGIANRGTTLSSYRDAWGTRGLNQERLLVFRRQGQSCPSCGGAIAKMRVAGRATHVCPRCQPLASDE